MRKMFILTAVLLVCIFATLAAIANSVDKEKGYITVTTSDTKEILPNVAEITIGIETSDKSLQKASEDNKLIANKVYSALKGLLDTSDYIRTNNYTARPVYSYTKENKRIIDKYVVNNTILVRTKKVDMVSKFVDTAISEGANNINNLQFLAVDYDTACNDTLAELTKKAYAQASTVAKSINTRISGIKSINTTCNLENKSLYPFGVMRSSMDSVSSSSATPVASGKIKIYANIDASFYVN